MNINSLYSRNHPPTQIIIETYANSSHTLRSIKAYLSLSFSLLSNKNLFRNQLPRLVPPPSPLKHLSISYPPIMSSCVSLSTHIHRCLVVPTLFALFPKLAYCKLNRDEPRSFSTPSSNFKCSYTKVTHRGDLVR